MTYQYGTVSSNVKILKKEAYKIGHNVKEFGEIREVLKEENNDLKVTLKGMNTSKNALFHCVEKFNTLAQDLNESTSGQGDLAQEVDTMCDDLFAEYEYIKLQNEKANLLQLFYDKQTLEDDDIGLSRNEFEWYISDLDDNIKDRFPSFDDFDKNDDGVISILEFEETLDIIYDELFEERKKSVDRKIGDHYKRKYSQQPKDADLRRKNRTRAIEREGRKRPPISIFKFGYK